MSKFKVGDSGRSLLEINRHHLRGGVWYHPEDVGMSEKDLRVQFPFLVWDSPISKEVQADMNNAKSIPKKTPKVSKKKR